MCVKELEDGGCPVMGCAYFARFFQACVASKPRARLPKGRKAL
jgi:hypothetical protein